MMDEEDKITIISVVASIGFIVLIVSLLLLIKKDYTIEIKSYSWETNVYIQEYQVFHYSEREYLPHDAYNVKEHRQTKTVTKTDDDGNEYKETTHYTVYDYDINEWVNTKTLSESKFDKSPFYADYECYKSGNPDGIGDERISDLDLKFYVHGTDVKSNSENLITIEVSDYIFNLIEVGDELNYRKNAVGMISDVKIAQ